MTMRKLAALICAAACAATVLSGCGTKSVKTRSTEITYADGGVYPMQCEDVLTVWSASLSSNDLSDTSLGINWQKNTGAKIEFIQPMNGSQEALSVLMASGDLPDIMIANLYNEPGGVSKFADDGVIIPLNDYMEEYAPNLTKYLKEHPDIDKMVRSDDGNYYSFPFIRGDERLASSCGLAVRKDMLDKAGLDVPETIDEWHTALQAFKNQGASAPLSYDLGYWEQYMSIFTGAYGTKADFYMKDGEVKYGYLEPEMKEALTTFNQWYKEGLIDKNIVKVADLDANILNSQTGASCMWAGSGIGKYMNAMAEKNSSFELVAAPNPVLNKGDRSEFGGKEQLYNVNNNAFITTACTNIELAMRFLDYGYSDEGHMFFNFGTDGESYNLVDGYPQYTDTILKPDGKTVSEAMNEYFLASSSGPFVQDYRYIEQYYQLDQQKDALDVWSETDAPARNVPKVSFTAEESQRLSTIMSNVQTTADEMLFKFIMGIEPLDNYDNFINKIKQLGIDEAIDIYTVAVERYNNR